MTTPPIPTRCTGYYVAQLGRIHHDGDTCPIHEADEPTPADIERGQFIARGLNELADIVSGPLWVRRYDEARRAEVIAVGTDILPVEPWMTAR